MKRILSVLFLLALASAAFGAEVRFKQGTLTITRPGVIARGNVVEWPSEADRFIRGRPGIQKMPQKEARSSEEDRLGRSVTIQVEVAETPEARAQGLMHRESLDEHAGMLFIFEETGRGGFWMKNTLIPLSIAFIDETWQIVDIKDMKVAPDPKEGPFTIYESAKPYRYALEVNEGFFTRGRITVGAKVTYVPRKP